jgi:hypothetical protein
VDGRAAGTTGPARHGSDRGHVDLFWLPLGAGGRSVRASGVVFESASARMGGRPRCDLYHSALEVALGSERFVVEMTPVRRGGAGRGVVCEGPVGSPWLGRSRLFRYEVRRWQGGTIGDVAEAVKSPVLVSDDAGTAGRLLDLVVEFPARTWGRDEQGTGEMWNSNSLTAWLLSRTGHDVAGIAPPGHGRAPGWSAGLVVARRQEASDRSWVAR